MQASRIDMAVWRGRGGHNSGTYLCTSKCRPSYHAIAQELFQRRKKSRMIVQNKTILCFK